MRPRFSIVIPYYDGLAHVGEAVGSVLSQGRDNVEVFIVDDRDPQRSGNNLDAMFAGDSRVHILHREQNGGTLRARRDGVLASFGEYVLLLDQDDALVDGSLDAIDAALGQSGVDILHFGAHVIAESAEAAVARDGMESFLMPRQRELAGKEILVRQFAWQDGFDWHVHHKAYRGEFARACWALVEDVELTLSDDLYLSFILASRAESYRAVGEPWYVYHLGRGETLSGNYSVDSLLRVSRLDAKAYRLLQAYANNPQVNAARDDWQARLSDVRDHLIDHVANEMADNLPFEDREAALAGIASDWDADALAGELWRFVRDRAYELYDKRTYPERGDRLHTLVSQAEAVDSRVVGEGSERYREMRDAARRHLGDLETIAPPARKLARALVRRVRG